MLDATTETTGMDTQSVDEALLRLAGQLKSQPAFVALVNAYRNLEADTDAQNLLQEARTLQSQLYFSWSDKDQARLNELVAALNQTPSIIAYHRAEQELRVLFQAVDAVISEAAGVEFALNAKRSCCGG
ncbi:MAG: hypothetical protein D6768_02920 [Chloroflexi bacterium]|nr:MAG: hypothetical protein D6768_02920 [Chloroflexota bacterium]